MKLSSGLSLAHRGPIVETLNEGGLGIENRQGPLSQRSAPVGRCGLAAPTHSEKIYRKGAAAAALRAKEGKKVAKGRRDEEVNGHQSIDNREEK